MSPLVHNWFALLSRVRAVGPLPAPIVGVLVDQACFSPTVHAAYFAYMSIVSSCFTRTVAEVHKDVQEKFWPAMQAGFAIWPAAIYINISYVPLHYRVLFVNVIGFGYGMLMNSMAHTT